LVVKKRQDRTSSSSFLGLQLNVEQQQEQKERSILRVIDPADKGKKNGEFLFLFKESSVQPVKAREMENFILDPKSYQSGQ